MPYSSHHFCPPPLQYTAARNDMPLPGKEDIRRPQCRRRRRQEEHMDRAPSSSCVCRPVACTCRKKKKRGHQMTLGDRHSRKDGRNEKIRHVQKGRQAYIQVGQQPSPPSPPHQFPAESELALCVTVLPPSRAHPVPHTHKSAVIRPHPVPLSIIRGRSYLARVPGRVQWGWGGPRGKGSRLPYHSSRKGGLKHAHDAPRGWKFSKAAATAGA